MSDVTESAGARRIVVAVAGRGDAAAVGYAVGRAIATRAELHLLHAVPHSVAELLIGEDSYRELEGSVLSAVAHDVVAAQPRPPVVTTELATGPVAETVVRHSRRADLLVVQHRPGRYGVELGSTVHGVLARASVPVAVVPAVEHATTGSVVLGVADPDEAPLVARAALREARTREARLTVLHARPRKHEHEHEPWTQRLGDAVADQAAALGAPTAADRTRVTVVDEDAADALVAASRSADLLGLGHRRRPHHGRDRVGPVVRHVVRHARCPVLVVPYADPRLETQTAR